MHSLIPERQLYKDCRNVTLFSASFPLSSLAQTCPGFKAEGEDPAPCSRPLPREAKLLTQGCKSIPPAPWDRREHHPAQDHSNPQDPHHLHPQGPPHPPVQGGVRKAGGPAHPRSGLASLWQTQRPFFSPPPVFAFLPPGPRHRDPAAQQPCPGMRGTRRSGAAAHPASPPRPPACPAPQVAAPSLSRQPQSCKPTLRDPAFAKQQNQFPSEQGPAATSGVDSLMSPKRLGTPCSLPLESSDGLARSQPAITIPKETGYPGDVQAQKQTPGQQTPWQPLPTPPRGRAAHRSPPPSNPRLEDRPPHPRSLPGLRHRFTSTE